MFDEPTAGAATHDGAGVRRAEMRRFTVLPPGSMTSVSPYVRTRVQTSRLRAGEPHLSLYAHTA